MPEIPIHGSTKRSWPARSPYDSSGLASRTPAGCWVSRSRPGGIVIATVTAVLIAVPLRSLDSTDSGGEDPPVTRPTLRAAWSPSRPETDLAAARGAARALSTPGAAGRTA